MTRSIVTADTDFGTLLATRTARKPSVIQCRGPESRKLGVLAQVLGKNLPTIADALEGGSIVTFEPSRIRVRALPISATPAAE
jgi:predicted nuclease of predicted toxin-antitoxin system